MNIKIFVIVNVVMIMLLTGCGSNPGGSEESSKDLTTLSIINEDLDQLFQSSLETYTSTVGYLVKSIKVSATAGAGTSITVNGVDIGLNNISQSISLAESADTNVNIVVTEEDSSTKNYIIVVSREAISDFAEQAYIKATNVKSSDWFGYVTAIYEDTLVVGAQFEDSNSAGIDSTYNDDGSADSSGAAYVFVRNGTTWTQQAYLKASNIGANDKFGGSVAIYGDTIAIGASQESSSTTTINSTPNDLATSAGAVYVFTRSGTVWTQEAYIKAANAKPSYYFGTAVDLEGGTLAVGSAYEDSNSTGVNSTPNDDGLANNSGAAYVFTRDGTTWTQEAYLKASNAQTDDWFGTSIAISGNTIAVGADIENSNSTGVNSTPNDDGSANNSGAVYVFTRIGTTWIQEAYIKASNTGTGDYFGNAVDLSDDTLVVGAYGEDSRSTGINSTPDDDGSAINSGAAYIFTRTGTTWSQQAYIKSSNTGADDNLGRAVVISGDTFAVGSLGEDSSTKGINPAKDDALSNSGATYVFTREGTVWTEKVFLKSSDSQADDYYGGGRGLSIFSDTIVIGVYGEDSSSTGINSTPNDDGFHNGSGAVYILQ